MTHLNTRLWLGLSVILWLAACAAPTSTATLPPTQTATITRSPTPPPTSTSTLPPTSTPTRTATPLPTPIGGLPGKIAFYRTDTQGGGTRINNLILFDLATHTETRLTDSQDPAVGYANPVFSPDGSRIAYVRSTAPNLKEIFVMDLDGTHVQLISPPLSGEGAELLQDTQPTWSPDGTRMAFSSDRHDLSADNPDFEIHVIDLGTGEIKQLTDGPGSASRPWFSPDGTKITFMAAREDANMQIYIMDADGSNVEKVAASDKNDRYPKWSNDGKSIIFHSNRDGNFELYIYHFEDGTTERITNDPATDATACFSPDDQWVVYQSDSISGNVEIYIRNLQSGQVINISNNPLSDLTADWSR